MDDVTLVKSHIDKDDLALMALLSDAVWAPKQQIPAV
jgi:hypothetical protein